MQSPGGNATKLMATNKITANKLTWVIVWTHCDQCKTEVHTGELFSYLYIILYYYAILMTILSWSWSRYGWYTAKYHIAQNSDGVKVWQISHFKVLAKKTGEFTTTQTFS